MIAFMVTSHTLQKAIIQEIVNYLGLPKSPWRSKLVELLLMLPAERCAEIAMDFNQQVGANGFCEASRWLLTQIVKGFWVAGVEQIPSTGPLIIAANHPGIFDTFLIAGCLPRKDIKIIAREMPLLHLLASTDRYMIYSTRDIYVKMKAAREAIRHLHAGGVLLVYPSGNLDPDPACMPGALQSVEAWSASLELLMRSEPAARLQVAISSGLVDPNYLHHPLVRMQKDSHWSQIVAEILQVSSQVFFCKKHGRLPKITFGEPYSFHQLTSNARTPLAGAIEAGRKCVLLHTNMLTTSVRLPGGYRSGQTISEDHLADA
jgi:hypothetical protein